MKKAQPTYAVNRSKKMKKKSWSETDQKHLKEIAGTMPIDEIAIIFGKTVSETKAQCNRQYLSYKYVAVKV